MTRCYLAVCCIYSRAGVKDKGKALWVIKIGCACTPPFPSPSPLAALILIFVLVRRYALSLRSKGCFSSQHPCCPEPRGTADCQLCHKSLQLLQLWWQWWPVSRESVTKKLILAKFQMLYSAGWRKGGLGVLILCASADGVCISFLFHPSSKQGSKLYLP